MKVTVHRKQLINVCFFSPIPNFNTLFWDNSNTTVTKDFSEKNEARSCSREKVESSNMCGQAFLTAGISFLPLPTLCPLHSRADRAAPPGQSHLLPAHCHWDTSACVQGPGSGVPLKLEVLQQPQAWSQPEFHNQGPAARGEGASHPISDRGRRAPSGVSDRKALSGTRMQSPSSPTYYSCHLTHSPGRRAAEPLLVPVCGRKITKDCQG